MHYSQISLVHAYTHVHTHTPMHVSIQHIQQSQEIPSKLEYFCVKLCNTYLLPHALFTNFSHTCIHACTHTYTHARIHPAHSAQSQEIPSKLEYFCVKLCNTYLLLHALFTNFSCTCIHTDEGLHTHTHMYTCIYTHARTHAHLFFSFAVFKARGKPLQSFRAVPHARLRLNHATASRL